MVYPYRHHRWRNFRPHGHSFYRGRDRARDQNYLREKEEPQFVCKSTDIFDCAEEQVRSMLQRRPEVHDLDTKASKLKRKFERTREPLDGLIALIAQAPRAALAQLQMDEHPHGYHDKQARLFELIDFNDTFDLVIMALSDDDRARFDVKIRDAMERTCRRVGAPFFTDEQWDAIVRGLSREIAVYLAAKNSGFYTIMASRSQDALGIDLQVMDPESHRYINLDIKSPSAFRHRLEQLVKEDRLTDRELLLADQRGYALEKNGHGQGKVPVMLFNTLADTYGDINDFRFASEGAVRERLNQLIRENGLNDGKFGIVSI